jgi:hypothetical protein
LTLPKSSPKNLNAAEEIGKLIDRFRLGAGWNLKDENTPEAIQDRDNLIAVFLEDLGAARVPTDQYERLYRRAKVTRARQKAEGKSVPFHLTSEELVAEWFVLQKEIAAAGTANKSDLPVEKCPNLSEHIDGEPIVELLLWGKDEVILPCHTCRPEAFRIRRNEFEQKRNASFASRRLEAGSVEEN